MRRASILLILAVLFASSAAAASLWLEPRPLVPGKGDEVVVHLMLGDRFAGEERAMDVKKVVAFQRLGRRSRGNLDRTEGTQPVAKFAVAEPGVEIVALTWQGETGSYHCKAVLVAGDAEPGHPLRFSELGQRLEIVPQTDPVLLARKGGKLEVQVLYEQEPLAGVRLLAMPKENAVEEATTAVTDEIGVASFDLTRGGPWLVEVAHKSNGERTRATLVIEAGAP